MDWDMEDANNVRFLAVRGTIWVGDCQTTYNLFPNGTLVPVFVN